MAGSYVASFSEIRLYRRLDRIMRLGSNTVKIAINLTKSEHLSELDELAAVFVP